VHVGLCLIHCCCIKGANLIIGGVIFHGVACGLIYRPIKAARSRNDEDVASAAEKPRSIILRSVQNEIASTASIDGTMITNDNCVVVADLDHNLRVIREDVTEKIPFTETEVGLYDVRL